MDAISGNIARYCINNPINEDKTIDEALKLLGPTFVIKHDNCPQREHATAAQRPGPFICVSQWEHASQNSNHFLRWTIPFELGMWGPECQSES